MKQREYIAKFNTESEKDETRITSIDYTEASGSKRKIARNFKEFIKNLELVEAQKILVYVYDLKECGEHILYSLEEMGFSYKHLTGTTLPIIGQYSALINDMGEWYYIKAATEEKQFEIRETKKLVPLSLDDMRKAFIGDVEADEIDIQKAALSQMFEQGLKNITIGGSCLKEYRDGIGIEFGQFFPHLSEEQFKFFEESYRGGWVLCPEEIECKHGYTLDENSLYPYVMKSRDYPTGKPHAFKVKDLKKILDTKSKYAFLRFTVTRFKLKDGALPFLEIKGDMRYALMGPLTSSKFLGVDGMAEPTRPIEFTMTETDYKLFIKYYDVKGFEFIEGYWFYTMPGSYLFGPYIDKWYGIKSEAEGGKRQIAKLMLNNLGGKFAANTKSDYKEPILKRNGSFTYQLVQENARKSLYIPVGCAMTAYGRECTIEAAIANKEYFRYSDTDSIHLECESLDQIKGVKIDKKKLGAWKIESEWNSAKFLRAKAYVEEDTEKGYIVKCAGLGDKCKENTQNFFNCGIYEYKDFTYGFTAPGAVGYRHIKGGCVRIERDFTLLENALERIR